MNDEVKKELDSLIKRIVPEIKKRFTSKEENRNLRQVLISTGIVSIEKLAETVLKDFNPNSLKDIPSNMEIESMIYTMTKTLKPRANMPFTPAMDATLQKFLKVAIKISVNDAEFKKEDVNLLRDKLTATLSSIAENEGGDSKEIVGIIDSLNITPENFLINENTAHTLQLQEFRNMKFNMIVEIEKSFSFLDIGFEEVKMICDGINKKHDLVRIDGRLIKPNDIQNIKIFTIVDSDALRNEMYWDSTMNSGAKKVMEIGKWTTSKLGKFGKDVTKIFLPPTFINEKEPDLEIEDLSIGSLINLGEGQTIEFKSRLKSNKNNEAEKFITKSILETIASFLNCQGGYLLIGVNDNGTICGLEEDFKLINKENKEDGFKLDFDNLISKLGNQVSSIVSLEIKEFHSKKIAVIKVKKKFSSAVYLNNGEELFVRKNASSIKLTTKEAIEYVDEHWPKK